MSSGTSGLPELSLILPVYNAEATLDRCLASVFAQSEVDLEVVAVDDGSIDGSLRILHRIAENEPRLRIFHQDNAGPSMARNTGLDAARGAVLATLDADDELLPAYAGRLVQAFRRTGADVVVFGAECEPAGAASKRIQMLLSPGDAVFEPFEADLLFSARAQPYAWRTAVSRDFEDRFRVRFPRGVRLGEDVAYQFVTYPLSKRTVTLGDKLYRYHMEGSSLTHAFDDGRRRDEKVAQHLGAVDYIVEEWRRRGVDSTAFADRMVCWALELVLFDLMSIPDDMQRRYSRQLHRILCDAYGPDWPCLPRKAVQRRVARAVARAAQSGIALSNVDVALFFASVRGVTGLMERLMRSAS